MVRLSFVDRTPVAGSHAVGITIMNNLSDLSPEELHSLLVSEGRSDIQKGCLKLGLYTNSSEDVADEIKSFCFSLSTDPACATDFQSWYDDLHTVIEELRRNFPQLGTSKYSRYRNYFGTPTLFLGNGFSVGPGSEHYDLAPTDRAMSEFDSTLLELGGTGSTEKAPLDVWMPQQERGEVSSPPRPDSTSSSDGEDISFHPEVQEIQGAIAKLKVSGPCYEHETPPYGQGTSRETPPRESGENGAGRREDRRTSIENIILKFEQGRASNIHGSIRSTATDYMNRVKSQQSVYSSVSSVYSTASSTVDLFSCGTTNGDRGPNPHATPRNGRRNSTMSLADVAHKLSTFHSAHNGEIDFD